MRFKRVETIALLILGAIFLCFLGFYNNYPLVYPDTGTYIYSGFAGKVPNDRPITYGLFIRHTSLAETTWLVIFAQGLIISLLIFYVVEKIARPKNTLVMFLSIITFLVLFTGISTNVSQLIPDVFAPAFLLGLLILLFAKDLKRRDSVIVVLLSWLSIIVHNSHLMISAILFLTVVALVLLKVIIVPKKRIVLCGCLIVISCLSVPSIHYAYGGGFQYSKGGHMFIMNKLVEIGILDHYLKRNCDKKEYKICEYKDNIPTDFLWDYDNSPVYKTGGWEKNEREYKAIIQDIYTTPVYLKKIFVKHLSYMLKQFFSFNTGDTPVQNVGSHAHQVIEQYFNHELREYLLALQQRNGLDYDIKNITTRILFFVTLIIAFTLLKTGNQEQRRIILFILIALVINAFVCANLSTVVPRYQSRVVWLLPFIIFVASTKSLEGRLKWLK